jgi:glucosamine--fructose-6-phosphate aminotransferase (isomerizing)
MCGIVGYTGKNQAYPVLIKGLQRLEYRGYDSAGVALGGKGVVTLHKCKGKVADLLNHVGTQSTEGTAGIGHTRWATHGEPNDVNSHPHQSMSGELALIHNGIIENYDSIKKELMTRGYVFKSDTDTEVLVNLIEEVKKNENCTLGEAVRKSLSEVVGAYAIVVMSTKEPGTLVAAKKSSPLVIGIGSEGDFYLASDATPIVEYTKNVVYLEDGEIAELVPGEAMQLYTVQRKSVTPYIQELEMQLEQLEKGGYDHFMMKEIYEQPRSIHDSMRGRLRVKDGLVHLGGMGEYKQKLINAERIIIVACGTSWHAGLVGEYLIEDLARIPVEVEYASEFRYRNPIIGEKDIVMAISQSGETADTLAALELAKSKGATILGICNVVGSTISRVTHGGSYTHAGPEIGVASTKAFTSQVTVLTLLALMLGQEKGTIERSRYQRLMHGLNDIPAKVERALQTNDITKEISAKFKDSRNFLYLGRGYCFPVALEGALKLKEISYIHAEGYPAAEMKHGPIALIDEEMPVVVIATKGPSYEKVVSNIQEVKARKGIVIAIVTEGDEAVKEMADYTIEIPEIDEIFTPLVASVPLQLLSYHIAVMRDCNVDQPRNLAKSVTVE